MDDITKQFWSDVFSILKHVGATERNRAAFIDFIAINLFWTEYRFMGDLGFGGKVRYSRINFPSVLYVTCYSEDETFNCLWKMKLTNNALKELVIKNEYNIFRS